MSKERGQKTADSLGHEEVMWVIPKRTSDSTAAAAKHEAKGSKGNHDVVPCTWPRATSVAGNDNGDCDQDNDGEGSLAAVS